MKKTTLILIGGIALALAAYFGGYVAGTAPSRAILRDEAPELAWLKQEFNLTDAEFKRVSELHEGYQPGCAERCRRIDQKNAELKDLLARADSVTPEVEKKLAEAAALRLDCQKAMLAHFIAVSRAMPPAQGKRYLAWIEQQTFMPEHRMAQHHH